MEKDLDIKLYNEYLNGETITLEGGMGLRP